MNKLTVTQTGNELNRFISKHGIEGNGIPNNDYE